MRTLTDPADDLLARSDDLEIHTQHTMKLDSAPDFHGSSEDEEALFAGLSGKPVKRVRMPKQAGVKQVHAGTQRPVVRRVARPAPSAGFLPGMGSDDDLAGPARGKRPQVRHVVARPRAAAPHSYGFLPGMGDLDGAAKRPQMIRHAPARRPAPSAGFLPGMGDFSLAGMGIGTLALIGVGAWLVLRRKRA